MNAIQYTVTKKCILSLFGLLLAIALTSALTVLLELDYMAIPIAAVVIICFDGLSLVFLARAINKAEQKWKKAHAANLDIRIDKPLGRFRTTARRDIAYQLQFSLTIVGMVIMITNYGDFTAMWVGVSICAAGAIIGAPTFYHHLHNGRKKNQAPY